MLLSKERILYLLKAFTDKTASKEEEEELLAWMREAPEDSELKTFIYGLWQEYPEGKSFNYVDWNTMLSTILKHEKVISIAPQTRKINWIRVAAAAVIFLGLAAGAYFLFPNRSVRELAKNTTEKPLKKDRSAPAGNKAMLTLSDGSRIELDSATNGTFAIQGNTQVIKKSDGQIAYNGKSDEVMYNTLSNPKGSNVVSLTLADGSKVWLNAESSLTFPVAFPGEERKVEITGEAYFEVAHDANKKFIVTKGTTTVQVLGTHFNVNAYDDENSIKVTLLEGSVKVENVNNKVIIKPGEQAQVGKDNGIKVVNDLDIQQVIAWQKGLFEFNHADLASIMRQVSRWYDVEVIYDGKITEGKFGGGLSKSLPLSAVLKLMEANGVKFQLEGKVLKVIP
jgi:transmembrane sensor